MTELLTKYQPDVWIHGHDHHHHDYGVCNTRVVANPAGYPTHSGGRENKKFDPRFVIEI